MDVKRVAPPAGYVARPATMADAAATTELLNACEIDEHGEPDYADGEVEAEWAELDLENDITLVFDPDGSPVGHLGLYHREHVAIDADIYVHPDHAGRGLGTFLVRLSEEQAQRHLPLAPPDAQILLRNPISGQNAAANALLHYLGYSVARHWWRMLIELDEPPAPPEWPAGLDVRTCVPGEDERAIYTTVEEAFRDHWNMGPTTFEEWERRKKTGNFDPELWFQVFDGEEMAAVALCRHQGDLGWINDVAVRRPWRRRGIATALLQHAFGAFYQRGSTRIGLGVDAQNSTGATYLYERLGMKIVRNFTFYEKVLRDGTPWAE